MRKRLRVAIVGYGTGGQASALMLASLPEPLADTAVPARTLAARWRDRLFRPMSRTPGAREAAAC